MARIKRNKRKHIAKEAKIPMVPSENERLDRITNQILFAPNESIKKARNPQLSSGVFPVNYISKFPIKEKLFPKSMLGRRIASEILRPLFNGKREKEHL